MNKQKTNKPKPLNEVVRLRVNEDEREDLKTKSWTKSCFSLSVWRRRAETRRTQFLAAGGACRATTWLTQGLKRFLTFESSNFSAEKKQDFCVRSTPARSCMVNSASVIIFSWHELCFRHKFSPTWTLLPSLMFPDMNSASVITFFLTWTLRPSLICPDMNSACIINLSWHELCFRH